MTNTSEFDDNIKVRDYNWLKYSFVHPIKVVTGIDSLARVVLHAIAETRVHMFLPGACYVCVLSFPYFIKLQLGHRRVGEY